MGRLKAILKIEWLFLFNIYCNMNRIKNFIQYINESVINSITDDQARDYFLEFIDNGYQIVESKIFDNGLFFHYELHTNDEIIITEKELEIIKQRPEIDGYNIKILNNNGDEKLRNTMYISLINKNKYNYYKEKLFDIGYDLNEILRFKKRPHSFNQMKINIPNAHDTFLSVVDINSNELTGDLYDLKYEIMDSNNEDIERTDSIELCKFYLVDFLINQTKLNKEKK